MGTNEQVIPNYPSHKCVPLTPNCPGRAVSTTSAVCLRGTRRRRRRRQRSRPRCTAACSATRPWSRSSYGSSRSRRSSPRAASGTFTLFFNCPSHVDVLLGRCLAPFYNLSPVLQWVMSVQSCLLSGSCLVCLKLSNELINTEMLKCSWT